MPDNKYHCAQLQVKGYNFNSPIGLHVLQKCCSGTGLPVPVCGIKLILLIWRIKQMRMARTGGEEKSLRGAESESDPLVHSLK